MLKIIVSGSRLFLLVLLLGAFVRSVEAQAVDALPMDSSYTVGRLDNGLTYMIRQNGRPENRATLWLAVNAGSILEDEDQLGLAHFLEHMAFNGTRDFEKQEMVDYLESTGMRFGPDLNAFTSFDETVYQLEVPTDTASIVDNALLIMENWASGITLDDDEIEKERGVVLEEMRAGRGAAARIRDKQLPVLLHESLYAVRLPIGTTEVLSTAGSDTFRRFYNEWYRPDLMAVIAVGDFDVAEMEAKIRSQFSGLVAPIDVRERPSTAVPAHQDPLVTVVSDPEMTATTVTVYHKLPKRPARTQADARRSFVEGVYHGMLNVRFSEIGQRPEAPFLFAGAGSGAFVRSTDVYIQTAQVRDGEVLDGLRSVLTEIERVERFGFTEGELERAKTNVLRSIESQLLEQDKRLSRAHAGEALQHFLTGAAIPGIPFEVEQARRDIPTITLEEVNAIARKTTTEGSRVIAVAGPEKEDVTLPEPDALLAVFAEVKANTDIGAWVDETPDQPLVSEKPRLSIIVRENVIEELGVTEWQLRNGVKVILKPTDFQNDQILLGGFSPGGHSLVDDQDFESANYATGVLSAGGLGEFDTIQLGKVLTGKLATASTGISEYWESVSGRASPQDLETMFQLLYLQFTAPRLDTTQARAALDRYAAQMENQGASPGSVFSREVSALVNQGHRRRRAWDESELDLIDFDESLRIYQDRFADASDFTFVMIGNFDPQEIKPLVMTWLGGLPSIDREETWRPIDLPEFQGPVQIDVWKGVEAKSEVRISMRGDTDWTNQDAHDIASLAQALRITLREELREELGGVYGVGVSGSTSLRPKKEYGFSVQFGCAPESVEELQAAVFAEFERVKREGFSQEVVDKVREAQRRSRETALEENGFWLGQLTSAYRNDSDPLLILSYDERVDAVSSEGLQAAARRYLTKDKLLVARLFPE
ncbi:MAG: zinc protease [Rhodothermales bacterium]|jgi:zinc protease